MIDLKDNDMIYKRFDKKLVDFNAKAPKFYKFVEFIVYDNGVMIDRFPSNEYAKHLDLVDDTKFKGNKNSIIRDSYMSALVESHLGVQQYFDKQIVEDAYADYEKGRPEIKLNFVKALYEKYCSDLPEEESDKLMKATRTYVDEGMKGSFEMVERLFVTFLEAYRREL